MNTEHPNGLSRYVRLFSDCETLADEILETPAGPRRFPGGTTELMRLPPGMDSFDLGEKLAVLENKKDRLKKLLAKLQDGHASVAVPMPPVLDMPHAAGTSSVLHAPPHNAAQASAALNAAVAQWPAAASFLSSGKAYPPVPEAFSFYYQVYEPGKRSILPHHTDRTFFWNCAFEEIVHAGKTLAATKLSTLFKERLAHESRPTTKGHEHWLPKQPEMLVKLWSAAKVRDIRGTGAITVLNTYWRTHSDRVLGALQQWFQYIQFLGSQSAEVGNAAAPTGDVLGDALRSIRTNIPDWPTFGDDVDRQCFTNEIMSRDELVNVYDTAHRGGFVDLQPIYAKIAREKSKRAVRNHCRAGSAAAAPVAGGTGAAAGSAGQSPSSESPAPVAGSGWPAPFPALPVAGDSLQRCGQGPRLPALSGGLGGLGLLAPPLVSFFQITHQCCRQRD